MRVEPKHFHQEATLVDAFRHPTHAPNKVAAMHSIYIRASHLLSTSQSPNLFQHGEKQKGKQILIKMSKLTLLALIEKGRVVIICPIEFVDKYLNKLLSSKVFCDVYPHVKEVMKIYIVFYLTRKSFLNRYNPAWILEMTRYYYVELLSPRRCLVRIVHLTKYIIAGKKFSGPIT